jgi:hypothetical protein
MKHHKFLYNNWKVKIITLKISRIYGSWLSFKITYYMWEVILTLKYVRLGLWFTIFVKNNLLCMKGQNQCCEGIKFDGLGSCDLDLS